MRNEPLERIYNTLQERPLQKKVLLACSFSQGHQLVKRITGQYGPVANLKVHTIESLVKEHSEFALRQAGMIYMDRGRVTWLVHALMHELASEPGAYVPSEMIQPGVVASLSRTLSELRTAMVSAEELTAERLADPRKGEYLRKLLRRYLDYLSRNRLVDYAGVMPYLLPPQEECTYLVLPHSMPNSISREMLNKLAVHDVVMLEDGAAFLESSSGFPFDKVEMFHATGSIAEGREVLRRILKIRTPLDQVEVIVSDYDKYAGIFYSLGEALGLPCTFAEGLPIDATAAGRAALSFLKWMENDFPADILIALLREGSITFRRYDEEGTGNGWAKALEKRGIGWGRERYELLLHSEAEEEEERRMTACLQKAFDRLWSLVPMTQSKQGSPVEIVMAVARFLKDFGIIRGPEEAAVVKQLEQAADAMRDMQSIVVDRQLAIRYVRELVQGIRTSVSPIPEPGMLHVSSLNSGGLSGRSFTFIVGMEERSWSSSGRQDPILLDVERERISEALLPSAERLDQARRERDGRLGMIRGRVTLSYASYDTAGKEPVSPAFELLQVYRCQRGRPEADFSELQAALGMPAGYWVAGESQALDRADVWCQELDAPGGAHWKDGHAAMERKHVNLRDGRQAEEARYAPELSEYDGWVTAVAGDPDSDESIPHLSASRLEHYARCPMRYYFSYELGLWPKETVEYDRSAWLRPDQRGSLLHLVFYRYLHHAARDNEGLVVHDRERLRAVTEQALAEYARMVPSPSPHIFEKECREIREDVEIFFQRELSGRDQPVLLEQELSVDGEPIVLQLEPGHPIRIKGFVDRIDRTGPHRYRIIDYKTGNPAKYRDNEYFSAGTQLQHALYAAAAEEWMRQTGYDPEAEVTEAAYLFPTVRGRGEQVIRLQNKRTELAHIVGRILASMKQGVYVPTQDPKQCTWCDYRSVCSRQAEGMEAKRAWPENEPALGALLEVENVD